jgi:FdhD protein
LRLTQARAPLTCDISAVNEHGVHAVTSIPAERSLTVYVDKRELVTLMTLGASPELLVLGYLRNQRLVQTVQDIESITVDWEAGDGLPGTEGLLGNAGVAAVKTRSGIQDIAQKTAHKVVTTGCGQGSVFGHLMDEIDSIRLPEAVLTQGQLYGITNAIRLQESTYKSAGSVHACALFQGEEMLAFVEDVGRHNAIDTIAGWMWMHGIAPTLAAARAALDGPMPEASALRPVQTGDGRSGAAELSPEGALAPWGGPAALTPESMGGADKVFYTTGRLTSEMVIKAAQMGVPIVVSRSGITQMGYEVAQHLGLCAIGRATNRHFLCYSAQHRLQLQPELALRSPSVA